MLAVVLAVSWWSAISFNGRAMSAGSDARPPVLTGHH